MTTLAVINSTGTRRRKGGKKKSSGHKHAHKASAHTRKRKTARRAKRQAVATVRLSNPGRKIKRRARRGNPVLSGAGLKNAILPAITGAAGAMVVDKAIDMFGGYLPVSLRTGWMRYGTLAAVALGLGFVLEKTKMLSPATRNALVGGSLTVIAYKGISEAVPSLMPSITTAPPPAAGTKGFQTANLLGYQEATLHGLGEMTNSAPVMGGGSYV